MKRASQTSPTSDRRTFLKTTSLLIGAGVLAPATAFATSGRPGSTTTFSPEKKAKKGCCFTTKEGSDWLDQIQKLKVDWFYSWGADKPADVPSEIEFVPMIWGYGSKSPESLQKLKSQIEAGEVDSKIFMGFNEPDRDTQSDVTVEQALEAWPLLMELGVPLVSPGCVHPDNEWMIEFMKGVEEKKLRVDYIAVHSYRGPDAKGLMQYLKKIYEMHGNRPLWLTEFAVGDWTAKTVAENKHSPEKIAKFMKEVLPMLDRSKMVARYSWFSASLDNRALGNSGLFDDSGELTELGKIYAAHNS